MPDNTVPEGAVVSLDATWKEASTLDDEDEVPNFEGIDTGAVDDAPEEDVDEALLMP